MADYFRIRGDKYEDYGKLEIHYDRFAGDTDIVWEWQDGPDGHDGGVAGWIKSRRWVQLILQSGYTGMYSRMGCLKWNLGKGPVPPKRPWFVNDPYDLQYLDYSSLYSEKLKLYWVKL